MTNQVPSLKDVDRLVHEPSRSIILAILNVIPEADFLYLQRETRLTKGNLTIHLSKLEQADFIRIEKKYLDKRPLTVCKITNKGRKAFETYREHLKKFIDDTKN
jgi:DNA-binding MarR family transcriptional regulator